MSAASDVAESYDRAYVLDRLAFGMFYDLRSVDAMARSMVPAHSDLRVVHAHDLMDTLVEAIIRSEFCMRVVGFHHLARREHTNLRVVGWCEIFYSLPVAIPFQHSRDNGMLDFHWALARIFGDPYAFYHNARTGGAAGELVLENFAARHELAARAWPSLLLTLCFVHFVNLLRYVVARSEITLEFALTLVRHGTRTLEQIVLGGPTGADLGRSARLMVVERQLLFDQLQELHAIVTEISLTSMARKLREFAARLAASVHVTTEDREKD